MNLFNTKWLKVLIAIILILGVFFRFANLTEKNYWKDEVFTLLRVSGYTEQEVKEQIYNGQILSIQDLRKYQSPNPEKNIIGTVKGLAKEEAQLPPLYFVMARLWAQLFGSSIAVTRSLAVLLSLLAFPCIYFLCRELFNSSLVGWIAMALMSISPFYVLFAQEARPYSLWTLTSLLSSWVLLRALRVNTKMSWGIYAITAILALYTSPFSLFLIIGHGIYVVAIERFHFNEIVRKYLFSLVAAIFAFSPWLAIIVLRLHQIRGRTDWSNRPYEHGIIELVFNWFQNITLIFIDFQKLSYDWEYFVSVNPFFYLVAVMPIMALTGYSIYFICRHTSKQIWLFILIWMGSTTLPLILPDLISGGRRSGTTRYLLPFYLVIEISIAYLLTIGITSTSVKNWKQKLGQITMVALFSIGILSCANISPKKLWWNHDPSRYIQNPDIAVLINQATNPLVITDVSWDKVMTLSYDLKSDVKFQLSSKDKIVKPAEGFSNYFLYQPSAHLKETLENNQRYTIKPVYQPDDPWLWQLEKN